MCVEGKPREKNQHVQSVGTLGRLGGAVGRPAGRCRGAGLGRAVPWGGRAEPGQAGTGVRADAQGVARKRTTDDGQPSTAVKTDLFIH